jgi:hypothetical protein
MIKKLEKYKKKYNFTSRSNTIIFLLNRAILQIEKEEKELKEMEN